MHMKKEEKEMRAALENIFMHLHYAHSSYVMTNGHNKYAYAHTTYTVVVVFVCKWITLKQ